MSGRWRPPRASSSRSASSARSAGVAAEPTPTNARTGAVARERPVAAADLVRGHGHVDEPPALAAQRRPVDDAVRPAGDVRGVRARGVRRLDGAAGLVRRGEDAPDAEVARAAERAEGDRVTGESRERFRQHLRDRPGDAPRKQPLAVRRHEGQRPRLRLPRRPIDQRRRGRRTPRPCRARRASRAHAARVGRGRTRRRDARAHTASGAMGSARPSRPLTVAAASVAVSPSSAVLAPSTERKPTDRTAARESGSPGRAGSARCSARPAVSEAPRPLQPRRGTVEGWRQDRRGRRPGPALRTGR